MRERKLAAPLSRVVEFSCDDRGWLLKIEYRSLERRILGVCAMIEGRSHSVNMTKRIVCLANSRKHSGRCIAGKEVLSDPLTDAYLCISLGEVHTDGYCYKLVATGRSSARVRSKEQ